MTGEKFTYNERERERRLTELWEIDWSESGFDCLCLFYNFTGFKNEYDISRFPR